MKLQTAKPFLELNSSSSENWINRLEHSVGLLGWPYDGTTSFRPGTRFGPTAAREASFGIETYCPILDRDYTDGSNCLDLGDLPFSTGSIAGLGAEVFDWLRHLPPHLKILLVGGEHSLTYYPVKALLERYPNLRIIQLDAHTDLRKEYLEDPLSHASVFYRIKNLLKDPQSQLCQYGIRSGTQEEFRWMKENKTLVSSEEELWDRLKSFGQAPIYLSVDLDFFDPSLVSGTGTPEAGGPDYRFFERFLDQARSLNLVGADVMELSPSWDSTGVSSTVAAKVIRSLLILMQRSFGDDKG